jgi:hypothetical protein
MKNAKLARFIKSEMIRKERGANKMGFTKDFFSALKQARAERKWINSLKKPISSAISDEKAAMTAKGEPWVGILRMDIDAEDLSNGSIELDWNDIFVARLVKAGYTGKNDKAIVDQWFQNICAGIVAENFEQDMADPEKRKLIQKTQLDGDRYEAS